MFFHTRSIRAVVFAIFIAFCNLATVIGARIVHNSLSELFSASAGEIHLGPSNQIRAAATLGTALELTYDVNKCTVGTPRSVLFDASTNDFEERNENPNSFIEHVPTVSRGIRVTDCSFGSEGSAGGGGLEMRGPTLEAAMYWRLRESASAPASIGVTLNDVWGAAPLHIVTPTIPSRLVHVVCCATPARFLLTLQFRLLATRFVSSNLPLWALPRIIKCLWGPMSVCQ